MQISARVEINKSAAAAVHFVANRNQPLGVKFRPCAHTMMTATDGPANTHNVIHSRSCHCIICIKQRRCCCCKHKRSGQSDLFISFCVLCINKCSVARISAFRRKNGFRFVIYTRLMRFYLSQTINFCVITTNGHINCASQCVCKYEQMRIGHIKY